jgi:hypothetical protein
MFRTFKRFSSSELKTVLAQKIPGKQAEAKDLKTKHGNFVLTNATVEQVYPTNF